MGSDSATATVVTSLGPIIGVLGIIVLIAFVAIIVKRARSLARVIKASPNRLMFDADLPPQTDTVASSTETRLATLDTLLMQGRITPEEYTTARAKVLGGL